MESAWVKEQKVVVEDGQVSEYRVTIKVSFVLKDEFVIVKPVKEK